MAVLVILERERLVLSQDVGVVRVRQDRPLVGPLSIAWIRERANDPDCDVLAALDEATAPHRLRNPRCAEDLRRKEADGASG